VTPGDYNHLDLVLGNSMVGKLLNYKIQFLQFSNSFYNKKGTWTAIDFGLYNDNECFFSIKSAY